MFEPLVNDIKDYKLLGLELGAVFGLFASLSLKRGIIPAFVLSIGLGYIIGRFYCKNKK